MLERKPYLALLQQAGLSLVELMVSMAIGAVILSGAIVVYLDQLQSSRRLLAYAQLQESGRVALDIIERDLRMASFLGCRGLQNQADYRNNLSSPASTFQPETGIQGWEASNTSLGQEISNVSTTTAVVKTSGGWATTGGNQLGMFDAVPNSDILRVWGGGEIDYPVTNVSTTSPPTVTVAGVGLDAGNMLLSDCRKVDIFDGDVSVSGSSTKITLGGRNDSNMKPFEGTYDNATITQLRGTTYLVSKQSNLVSNPPSLFRAELDLNGSTFGNLVEVVQGVESMQLLFGVETNDDINNSVDAYVTANNVSDWQKVVSVQVSLLMQSVDDNLADGPVPYFYNGIRYDGSKAPNDARLRRVFSRTITLRNRTLGVAQ